VIQVVDLNKKDTLEPWQGQVSSLSRSLPKEVTGGRFNDSTKNIITCNDFFVLSKGGSLPALVNQDGKHNALSTTHIWPFAEYVSGGSMLKMCKGGAGRKFGGGLRGDIKGFSYGSRRRLMLMIARLRRDAELPVFITLTYPADYPDPNVSKVHLNAFFKRFKRRFEEGGAVWKLEPQERGAPHFHILVWGCELSELMEFVPSMWYEIAGGGDILHLKWHRGELGSGNKHCVQKVKSFRGVWAYASKYLGKTFDVAGWGKKWTGRFWGVKSKENVPFGEETRVEVEKCLVVEVMRYQRRFAKIRGRDMRSLTIFCDADQWVERLIEDKVVLDGFLYYEEEEVVLKGSG